jgi:VIT1/CCC1 family predicted Fe2+/Mn2+ transporter
MKENIKNYSRLKRQLHTEMDTAFLYMTVSRLEKDKMLSGVYMEMSEIEMKHARHVLSIMEKKGIKALIPGPTNTARIKAQLARWFGYSFILDGLMKTEKDIAGSEVTGKLKNGKRITGSELNHKHILENLMAAEGVFSGPSLSRLEGRHKTVGGNALRAAVLGSNDGLVSNLCLIMGVAGASTGRKEIAMAGIAGLLAGSISMALGEWLSVQSSRELFSRQVEEETEEFENSEEEELKELTLIYQAKGMSREKAAEMANEIFKSKETAIETLVLEELGIDARDPGASAWEAAFTSFALFAAGAIIPLVPFFFVQGNSAVMLSALLSALGLFLIGGGTTLFTGRNLFYSGLRQILFGLGAATITYCIGKLLGTAIRG